MDLGHDVGGGGGEGVDLGHDVSSSARLVAGRHRLLGLVVKAFASRAADLSSIPAFRGSFPRSSPATCLVLLPGACRYRVSAGTGRPGAIVQ